MQKSPALSWLTTAASTLRGMWKAVRSRFGYAAAEPDEQAVAEWVSGIFRQLEDLLAQFRAGTLVATDEAESPPPRRDAATPPKSADASRPRVTPMDPDMPGASLWQADAAAIGAGEAGDVAQAGCVRRRECGRAHGRVLWQYHPHQRRFFENRGLRFPPTHALIVPVCD